MDEQTWMACTDPHRILEFLRRTKQNPTTERKLFLFACACCRRVWPLLEDERSRQAVEVAEQFADGLMRQEKLVEAVTLAERALKTLGRQFGATSAQAGAARAAQSLARRALRAAMHAANHAMWAELWAGWTRRDPGEGMCESLDDIRQRTRESLGTIRRCQCELLRDMVSNPFRPPQPLAPSVLQWQGGTVKRLAEDTYQERLLPSGHLDPARLAVLADALEEAGADVELVGHLRGPGPHVRGCCVIDLLTGRR